jgi:predicted transposase/invertase (TIGR01784 family)
LETETYKELTDAGEIHFMEMPVLRRYIEQNKEGITEIIGKEKLLDWLLFIDNPDSEYAKLAESSNDAIGRAKDMLKTLSADEKLREEYLAREKAIMDHYASLKAAEKYGREEGREEGIGLGEERKGIRMAKNLYKMGIPLYQISEASEISIDELKQILKI